MATHLKQVLAQKQKLSPTQVLQAKLLQLNAINLEQAILDELELNPLLEQVETDTSEDVNSEDESLLDALDLTEKEVYEDDFSYNKQEEKEYGPLAESHSFLEDVIAQLDDTGLSELEVEIAEEIIWNVNDRGYLDTELILIADRFGKKDEDIEDILKVVQRLEPKGLGSRNIQECLLVQLEDDEASLAWKIVHYLFEDFMHKRYEKIQTKTKCSHEALQEAIELISQLNPRPGEGLQDRYQVVIPDLIVREENDGWRITTNDGGIPEVRVNQEYAGALDQKSITAETKKFMKEKLDSAHWFVDAVNQRRRTMLNVMKTIIEKQTEFFKGNIEHLQPMVLQDIADIIKMDISTISRSTRGKFVDTPYGVFELKHFFSDAVSLDDGRVVSNYIIKIALEKIILAEDKKSPLNDDELGTRLAEVGYKMARRTVAKYRDQLGYPVARLRKEF
ncbi:MAG: RNA polymerase factor sigma-54 [Candidatus Marinimicrobia bacterium]|mgnify:CR=1 FL=1|jgi:RNA polymerase sigma-54 factor|nr:RNA polymerase factor sigma-54 [Candidatus Neomarinimicrobiota bacterium]MBT3496346.1 RNA polymerase factor sigma-54 [Candidatus Neomarinimicrobiota bacterium]MBT3692520.1 RNA polymerase factor sigma-54 [Candidatus Neomarinimicrobiota bacterium]MBT3732907.1 RNA polymerase factor sigma-54 [Candidatus Neomarinimicrobiota bacterium]MBT4144049.1 RNA polymerase factor sigma-54 [Candidatus Neomarinimicrobiota bacterium]